MRWVNLLAGAIAAIVWGLFLFGGMRLVGMIACANLPDFPIVGELVFSVVIPTAMLVLTLVSVALALTLAKPAKAIAWFPYVALVLALVYFAFITGVTISPNASVGCPF